MGEVLIAPWVLPVSPENIKRIDDGTTTFSPQFGRGSEQVGLWADPRWGLKRKYQALRVEERSAITAALNEARGKFNKFRVTPHRPRRGSALFAELLTNGTFVNGTTGWTSYGGTASLSVTDRVLRVTQTAGGATGINNSSAITVQQYVPYVLRAFVKPGRVAGGSSSIRLGTVVGNDEYVAITTASDFGMLMAAGVPYGTSSYITVGGYTPITGLVAGDFWECPYVSLARCALVDGGVNLLLQSDDLTNVAAWGTLTTGGLSTVTANATASPDGATTADSIVENSANTNHARGQSVTVSASVKDYTFAVALKAGSRTWAQVAMGEGGGTSVGTYINLSTGALGSTLTGGGWASARAVVRDMGNGWYYIAVTARKTTSATTITPAIYIATGDTVNSYTGNGSGNVYVWRTTLSQSSVPSRLAQSTSSQTLGSQPDSGGIYLKGLPASTSNLLYTGEHVEWDGELKQLTAPIDSDAAGLGYLKCRPAFGGTPADNDPVVIQEPFGTYRLPNDYDEENMWGQYSSCELDFVESYT